MWCLCVCARECVTIQGKIDCALLGVTSLALQRKAFIAEVKLRPVWCVESKKNILVRSNMLFVYSNFTSSGL